MATATSSRSTRSATPASTRNWLAELSRESKAKPTAAVLYGPPGVGKTSFGASMPKPIFLIDNQEDGINTLKASGLVSGDIPVFPPASEWRDVLGILDCVATEDHGCKTLVIDSLGGMERLCHTEVCQRDFNGNWGDKGFGSYQKGYEVSLADWRQFLAALDRVRSAGIGVMCLAHSLVKPFKNPDGEDYDRYVPDLHHKTWSVTHKWADMVLFANYYVETSKEDGRAKGRGGQNRIMYTEYHAAYEAKNRHALPSEVDMGASGMDAWSNLKNEITKARKS